MTAPETNVLEALCDDGKPCHSSTGGACSRCHYPVAYAHPTSLLAAFEVEVVWINGTAIEVRHDRTLVPGIARIYQRDGSFRDHPIPETASVPVSWTQTDTAPVNWTLKDQTDLNIGEVLSRAENAKQHLLTSHEERPLFYRQHLLDTAGRLLFGSTDERSLSEALIAGLAARTDGWLSPEKRKTLQRFLNSKSKNIPTKNAVQLLLQEIACREKLNTAIVGSGWALDDGRHLLRQATIGPFSEPLSRLRIALLPGEAEHVEIYDIRVGEARNIPIGISMISRLPEYNPGTVREIPESVNISGTLVRQYLPGRLLAGQLRDGVDPTEPGNLSPKDLQGGLELDLGALFPPMSYVYLFYRVSPGHIFYATVTPIKAACDNKKGE